MNASADEISSNLTSGENKSYWIKSTQPIIFQKLQENIITDVLIVGGGISGLTSAYCLLEAGLKVVLVEDGYIGSGETGRTTAHLSFALDDHYYVLEKIFGLEKAILAAESHMQAVQWIDRTVKREGINCHFKRVPGYLFVSESDNKDTIIKEYAATKRVGLLTETLEYVPGIDFEKDNLCIKYPDQAQFHIMLYLNGLVNAIVSMGGRIFTETKAEDITEEGAKANGYDIKASHIVVATNTPVNNLVTMHTKQWPYRTYVIAAKIPRGILPYSLWWDTGDQNSKWISKPYHYVRLEELDNEYDLLISGGEDHKTGQADEEKIPEQNRYLRLIEWTKKRFPAMGNIEYRWSGQVVEPLDSLGLIGRNPGDENIYIITGDSGDGLTNGTLGGILIKDLITGKKNQWEDLYNPSRKPLKNIVEYLHEAGNMSAQYIDWITKEDVKDANDLLPGQGAIISSGTKKIAAYCDEQENLHTFSAVCPHMGGILQWNAEEKSFDCPVHGSRFTAEGYVINGPATSDLKRVQIKQEPQKA